MCYQIEKKGRSGIKNFKQINKNGAEFEPVWCACDTKIEKNADLVTQYTVFYSKLIWTK